MTRYSKTRDDERGQMNGGANVVIGLIIALTVGALIAAFLLPIGVDALVGDSSASFTLNESETGEVNPSLNVTLDDVDDSTSVIDVTLNDTDGTSATILDIAVGGNKTATIGGETITVHNDANVDNTTATLTVDYPIDYAWGSGASALWSILDVIIVLALFLFFIAIALSASNRV